METKKREFKRSKAKWADETAALVNVANVNNVAEKHLVAEHTETHFVWTIEVDEETDFPVVRFTRDSVADDNEAEHKAMQLLGTFGGNLKPDHTEAEYIFSIHRMN